MFPILCCSGPSAADDGDLTMDEDFVPPDREPLRSERRSELVEVERLLTDMESRLSTHINLVHKEVCDLKVAEQAVGGLPTDVSHVTHAKSDDAPMPGRSSHFYRARVPDHFRQLVSDSLRSPQRAGRGGNLGGPSSRSAGSSFQWDSFRLSPPQLSSCAAFCEIMILTLVIAYSILMGLSLQQLSSTGEAPAWAYPVDLTFNVLFVIDVAFRCFLEGRRFFCGPGARWNIVDSCVVFFIVLSQLLSDLGYPDLGSISVLRLLRILRILGVARLLRFFCRWRAFRYLRTLAASLVETSKCMLPLMAFVLAIVYLFGMVLTEGIWEVCRSEMVPDDVLCAKFGTLNASMMTLFQILYHGILWGPVWDAFGVEMAASWFLQSIFLLFVCFALIVVSNVLASFLFTLQKQVGDKERDTLIQNEIESKEEFLRSMALVFRDFDQNSNGAISWTEFELALEDERMLAFLASMGLDISDAIGLFEVLDSDSTGAIEQMEFLLGCLRLRGGAKAVDLVRVQMEQEWVHRAMLQVRQTLGEMGKLLQKIQKTQAGTPFGPSKSDVMSNFISDSKAPTDSYNFMQSTPLPTPKTKHRTQLLPHERAVTLQELELIAGTTDCCRREGWMADGKLLQPHEVNLYHFNYEHILPQTAPDSGILLKSMKVESPVQLGDIIVQCDAEGETKRPPQACGTVLRVEKQAENLLTLAVKIHKGRFTTSALDGLIRIGGREPCGVPKEISSEGSISYKELLSSVARLPAWYCSHWWGEPIRSFVSCCKRHGYLRGLTLHGSGTYWVCGYANRQHELQQEIGSDLKDSSFYQALQVADGILLILDQEAKPFSRIWCDYELYAAITDPAKDFDLVTATEGVALGPQALMLSKNLLPQESAVAKSVREQNFPISFLLRGLSVRLEDGEATVEADKMKILSAMAGGNLNSSRGQMLLEKNLKHANDTLHSTLAVLAWPQAMQRGLLGEMKLAEALSADVGRERLELSLAHFEASCTDAAMKVLATGLPPNLQELRLSFEGCNRITDAGVSALVRHLNPKLKLLYLDFIGCALLTDSAILSLAKHLPSTLIELQVHVAGCEGVGTAAVQHLKQHWPASLHQFRGSFKGTAVNRNFRNFQELQSFWT
ncbi:unnamed protein product [Durusdinium trenchii]|uniref:EF-hand domain-containing protein n=3 Tax=Durusdinium trenchii TaxID=1381693 RepID=A0ABP0SYU7_9DINO